MTTPEIAGKSSTSDDPAVAYLSLLFTGALHERQGLLETAAHDYRMAIERFPTYPAAYIALSAVCNALDMPTSPATSTPGCGWHRPTRPNRGGYTSLNHRATMWLVWNYCVKRPAGERCDRGGRGPDVTGCIAADIRVNVDAVPVDVLVTDGNRPVGGLRASDFELRDSGVLQRIESVSFEDVRSA